MAIPFNPNQYKGKNQVYQKLPHHQGICWIWDWSTEKNKYIQRQGIGPKYYCYKKINGRQVSQCFEDLKEAKKWRNSTVLFTSDATFQSLNFKTVQVRFFAHNQNRWKITTTELYETYLKHFVFFNELQMHQINSYAVDEWLKHLKSTDYLKGQHSTRLSYQHELTLLKQICSYYAEYIDETYIHPCKKRHNSDCIVDHEKFNAAKNNNKTKFLPLDECLVFLQKLKSSAEGNSNEWLYYHLAEFQMFSGCRIGETCALSWSDIDWNKGQVHVSKTVQWARHKKRQTQISSSTKTSKARQVSLPIQLMESLKSWSQKCNRTSGLIFSDSPFVPIPYRATQYRYNSVFKQMASNFSSTHIMRHSFATLWLTLSGGAVQSLQKQLGHSTPQQSMHYAKVTDELIKEGMLGFENGLGKVISIQSKSPEILDTGLGQAGSSTR